MSGRRHAKARPGRRAKAGSRATSASKARVAAPWARATASRARPTAKVKVKARSKAKAESAFRPSTASAGEPRAVVRLVHPSQSSSAIPSSSETIGYRSTRST